MDYADGKKESSEPMGGEEKKSRRRKIATK